MVHPARVYPQQLIARMASKKIARTRAYEVDSKVKEIEAFAKANGWSIRVSDAGIRMLVDAYRILC